MNRPKRYIFESWDEMMESLETMEYSKEGYMVYDSNRRITKIVNPNFKMVKDMKKIHQIWYIVVWFYIN